MTYEECVNCLPDKLKALGYKMVEGKKFLNEVINFHLDDDCQDWLFRIVQADTNSKKCICYAQNINSTEWKLCYYKDFNDTVYYNIMDSAKRMVAQYKEYTINLKINELSKDF